MVTVKNMAMVMDMAMEQNNKYQNLSYEIKFYVF